MNRYLTLVVATTFTLSITCAAQATTRDALADSLPGLRKGLDRILLDLPKARFMDVKAWRYDAPAGAAVIYCGQVNAPNAMGGMAGWQPFWGKIFLYADGRAPMIDVRLVEEGPLSADKIVNNLPFSTDCGEDGPTGAVPDPRDVSDLISARN